MERFEKVVFKMVSLCAILLLGSMFMQQAFAQDQFDQDDPPGRVARLAFVRGAVSFQPAGESEWVEAIRNRPLTTGDRIWADRDSRAELQLGEAVIHLNSNTGFSFLNLDDRTVQIQLTSGAIDVRVQHLYRDDIFEIDTPNQAFSIYEPGRYRIESSEDGNYSVVSIREGEGESTASGRTYTIRAGERATFEGIDSLNAQLEDIGNPDDFDNWSYDRDRRYENAVSSRYVSPYVVGYDDLDDAGDWRPTPNYGTVWFPRVANNWAPYRDGHWAWIDPWGWSWVDDEPWGYAPFHYGRWVSFNNRWGWIPGPRDVRPVYAPALVVFVGGNGYGGGGGNVGWFPLGPREVYVPGYRVSRGYVDRVNVSNTVVNTTVITNVYNTTIVRNNTSITNVTYVNRNISGAVTAVPQRAFVSSQPVARSVVAINQREFAAAPMTTRAAVVPTSESVFGARANTAGRVAAPPAAVANRQVVAKAPAPPPPVPFAAKQQALAARPGEGIAHQDVQRLRPTNAAEVHPQVKQAPPGKPVTPAINRTGRAGAGAPGNTQRPEAGRPEQSRPASNQPAQNDKPAVDQRPDETRPAQNRPGNEPPARNDRRAEPPVRDERPNAVQPDNRPGANPSQPNRPDSRPVEAPDQRDHRNGEPDDRSVPNRVQPPEANRPPDRNDRPNAVQPDNRPGENPPQPNRTNNHPVESPDQRDHRNTEPDDRSVPNRVQPPEANRRPDRNDRPSAVQPNDRPQSNPPQPNEPPQPNRPDARKPNTRPEPDRQNTPAEPPPNASPNQHPDQSRPQPPNQRNQAAPQGTEPPQRPLTPAEKKKQEEDRKKDATQDAPPQGM